MHLAPLDNSIVFKKLLRDPEILSAFFKDLTGIEVQLKPENIELEKRFNPAIGLIDTTFDSFAEDPVRRIIIEIQRVKYTHLLDRFIHYHFAAIMEMQRSHREYTLGRTVFTIMRLTSTAGELLFNRGVSTSRFFFEATDGAQYRIYLINPNCLDATVPASLADWLKLVYESIRRPQNPQINSQRQMMRRATDLIAEEEITPKERAEIMDEKDWLLNLDQREAKGFEKGKTEGAKEGKAAGADAERKKLILAISSAGADLATMARLTGLSEAEV